MSIPVELEALAAAVAERTMAPYLLTSGEDGRPHTVAAPSLTWDGAALAGGCGRSTARNAAARPKVSLLWPPDEPTGYSLIVDADAEVSGDEGERRIRLSPTHAVLHRPAEHAPGPDATTDCLHDCRPVLD